MNQNYNEITALKISDAIYYAKLNSKSINNDGLDVIMRQHFITNKEIQDFDVKFFAELLREHIVVEERSREVCFPATCYKWKNKIKLNYS